MVPPSITSFGKFLITAACSLACLASPLSLHALEGKNPKLSLLPEPLSSTHLMGLPFGENPSRAVKELIALGLELEKQETLDENRLVKVLTFQGIPQKFYGTEGRTIALFFRNKLIRADFVFEPKYRNFLIVKNALFSVFEERFSLEKEQNVMDDFLKSHLAQIDAGDFNASSEALIESSLKDGKTFFYYKVKDQQDEFNIAYSFFSAPQRDGNRTPRLQLHYSLKEEMDTFQQYRKRVKEIRHTRQAPPQA